MEGFLSGSINDIIDLVDLIINVSIAFYVAVQIVPAVVRSIPEHIKSEGDRILEELKESRKND